MYASLVIYDRLSHAPYLCPKIQPQASQGSRCGSQFTVVRGNEAQVTSDHPMFLPPSSLDYRTEPPCSPGRRPLIFINSPKFLFPCKLWTSLKVCMYHFRPICKYWTSLLLPWPTISVLNIPNVIIANCHFLDIPWWLRELNSLLLCINVMNLPIGLYQCFEHPIGTLANYLCFEHP
jgi:hypothetical protein